MKDFFELREETQQLDESAMTDALNDLQDYWSDNAEYFMNQKKPLFPMFSRPFDRIRKGGVLFIGINPGSGSGGNDKRIDLLKMFNGKQPPVFNSRTRTWRNVDFDRVDRENRGGQEKNVGFSTFDLEDWENRGGGTSKFHKNINIILKKIERDDLNGKIMSANIIPFPSTDTDSFGSHKTKLTKLGFKWIEELIKISDPKVIITAGKAPWDEVKKGMLTKTIPDATIKALSKEGNPINTNLVQVGYYKTIPVIGLHHPTRAHGHPSSLNFKGKQLDSIKAVFNKYVK